MTNENINRISFCDKDVTYGNCVWESTNLSLIPFRSIVERIKADAELKDKVSQLRMEADTDKKNKLKQQLPYFSMCRFKNERSNADFQSTYAMIFDFDHLQQLDEVRSKLENWEYTAAVFTSPSGTGLKLIVKLNRPITRVDEYKEVYGKVADYIHNKVGVFTDKATHDPARACFLSYDPGIYVNETSKEFDAAELLNENIKIANPPTSRKVNVIRAFSGTAKGNRHVNLAKQVGLLASKNLDKEFTHKITSSINKLNDPPLNDEEFDYDFSKTWNSFSETTNKEFWSVKDDNGKTKLTLDVVKLLEILEELGYRKIRLSSKEQFFAKISNNIITKVSVGEIKDFVKSYVKGCTNSNKRYALGKLIQDNQKYFSEGALGFIDTLDPKIKRGTQDKSFLFFKNGYVSISPNKISFCGYSDLKDEYVWQENVIDKNIDLNSVDFEKINSEFNSFLMNVCGKDVERYHALRTGIGYMLHDYKDKSLAKAVVLCDEEIPTTNEAANGGTGKSIIGESLKYLRNTVIVDGKNVKTDSQFVFQQVDLDTFSVVVDDARKDFDFESLFNAISSDLTVEKKHRAPFTIPFEQAPKFLITTNGTIHGSGNSYERRKFEVELSSHYNKNFTPMDDFNHRLFDDWNDEEWNLFYCSMISYVQAYLKSGLVTYNQKNLFVRKIIDATSRDFFDFMEENAELDKEYDRAAMFDKFKSEYADFTNLRTNTFTKWLKIYADNYGWEFQSRKSNSKTYIRFGQAIPTPQSPTDEGKSSEEAVQTEGNSSPVSAEVTVRQTVIDSVEQPHQPLVVDLRFIQH